MRLYPLLVTLFVFTICSYSLPQPFATSQEAVQTRPASAATSEVQSASPAAVLASETTTLDSAETEVDRAYEEGIPLVARVNGQPVFLDDFEKQVNRLEQTLAAQEVDLSGPEGQARLNQIRQQVFEALLDQAIIEQQASSLGIQIDPGQVEVKAQETIAQLGNQQQFEQWLASNQLSYQEFLDSLRSELIAGQLFEHITQNIPELETEQPLTEEEVQQLKREFFLEWLQKQRSAAAIEKFVAL